MVVSFTSRPYVLENAEGLIKDIQENLKGKKFLLVLDDVWNDKPEEWDKLRNSLLAVGGARARGSNILVTTRRQEVIDVMRCSDPYQVQKLSEEDSWELFKHRAFTDGEVLETEAFSTLGRRMVKMCDGLPLAIKTLGGLLYSKKTEQEWLRIQNSEIWKLEGALFSLRLSYNNLPYSSLKRCFAYCSTILKDSYIYKDEIIELWMALGFLSGDDNVMMEDIGNEYFNIFDDVNKALYVRLEGFENLKPKLLKVRFDTVQALYAKASTFNVVQPDLKHLRRQLGKLKNLRGEFSLYELDEVENIEEASKAKLCEKSDIQRLVLEWRNNEDEKGERECSDEDVMEGLEAHPNLKVLSIYGFMVEEVCIMEHNDDQFG
ncbi:putative disease resistance protein RGA3 [Apium graveolens]|uniref:putative disease resistance protein RGA3 n=1 Tax=Apium graveolens TaxID=4045 RepID=UPI003D797861